MKYSAISQGGSYPYPDHNIDPKKKNADWCMQYARAAYYDSTYTYPRGMFANNRGVYQKNRLYSIGKQPIDQYKPLLGVDQQNNDTQLLADWSIRPIVLRYMNKALARIHKVKYRPQATPVDMLAKSEADKWLSGMKAKLMVREQMMQQNPELANHPLLAYQPGEAVDIEELEMRIQMGEQFNRSKDAEIAIELGWYENNMDRFLKQLDQDLWNLGVAGYKEWLGEDLKPKFRAVDPDVCIVSYSKYPDFHDIVHAGEVIMVSLIDLATMKDASGNDVFSEEEMREFASSVAGRWGNPQNIGTGNGYRPIDKFKCQVLDIEFFSYDDLNFRVAPDSNGNIDFRKADYNRGKTAVDKYVRKTVKNVYKCKWIIGTDKCYDWGVVSNPKRSNNLKKKGETSLSYRFFAYNFVNMMCESMMDQLIPDLDDYQLTIMRIQNWKNRAVPSGFWIDIDALENVAIDKGGKNMTKKEILQMFFDSGILVGRSKDIDGDPMGPNWKPIIPIENSVLSELVTLYQELQNIASRVETTCGYNPVTSGTPQERMLTPGYESAEMSTEDTLYPIVFCREQLVDQLAKDVLARMQQGVRLGKIEGHMPYQGALNQNALTFVQVSPDIAYREYGIMIEARTSNEQKMWLLQQMQQDIANGFLDSSDAAILINTHNVNKRVRFDRKVKRLIAAANLQLTAALNNVKVWLALLDSRNNRFNKLTLLLLRVGAIIYFRWTRDKELLLFFRKLLTNRLYIGF